MTLIDALTIRDQGYIRANALEGFVDFVASTGGDAMPLLAHADIPETMLESSDSLVRGESFLTLINHAASVLNLPDFGLEWAMRMNPNFPNIDALLMCARFTRTAREWSAIGLKYHSLYSNSLLVRLLEDEASGTASFVLTFQPTMSDLRQSSEHVMACLVGMVRVVLSLPDEKPILVRFMHGRPASLAKHDLMFGCPIEFDCAHDELVFDRKLLEHPTGGRTTVFEPLLDFFVRHRFRKAPAMPRTIRNSVSMIIASMLGANMTSIEHVATAMGIHSKKLQRMLERDNVTYSAILDDVRKHTAMRCLTESDVTIARLAQLLDYSSNPAFTLAFNRWTGMSPSVFRQRARRAPESGSN